VEAALGRHQASIVGDPLVCDQGMGGWHERSLPHSS
jgi:hypothetical protein